MTNLITVNDVGFSYKSYDSDPVQAIEHVSFEVAAGEYVVYLVAMALVNRPCETAQWFGVAGIRQCGDSWV